MLVWSLIPSFIIVLVICAAIGPTPWWVSFIVGAAIGYTVEDLFQRVRDALRGE